MLERWLVLWENPFRTLVGSAGDGLTSEVINVQAHLKGVGIV